LRQPAGGVFHEEVHRPIPATIGGHASIAAGNAGAGLAVPAAVVLGMFMPVCGFVWPLCGLMQSHVAWR